MDPKNEAPFAFVYCRLPSARWSRSSRHPAGVIAHAVIELEAGAVPKASPADDIADVLPPALPVLAAIRDEIAGLGVASGGDELDFHLPPPGSHRHADADIGAALGRRRHLGLSW